MPVIVTNGNFMFTAPRGWADDRPALQVASYPRMLRFIARQLARQGCWLSYPVETVARDWDGDPMTNLNRLADILAHTNELTPAQVSRLERAREELERRCSQEAQA